MTDQNPRLGLKSRVVRAEPGDEQTNRFEGSAESLMVGQSTDSTTLQGNTSTPKPDQVSTRRRKALVSDLTAYWSGRKARREPELNLAESVVEFIQKKAKDVGRNLRQSRVSPVGGHRQMR